LPAHIDRSHAGQNVPLAHFDRSQTAHLCRKKKLLYLLLLKKNKKVEFQIDHYKHSLKISAKSVEKSGCGH
jgi:hypothetical protein